MRLSLGRMHARTTARRHQPPTLVLRVFSRRWVSDDAGLDAVLDGSTPASSTELGWGCESSALSVRVEAAFRLLIWAVTGQRPC